MPACLTSAAFFFTVSTERHFYNFQIPFIKYRGLKVQGKGWRDDQVLHIMICCLVTFQRSHELKGTLWYWGQHLAFAGNTLWASSKRYSALRINSTWISNTINQSWNRMLSNPFDHECPRLHSYQRLEKSYRPLTIDYAFCLDMEAKDRQ